MTKPEKTEQQLKQEFWELYKKLHRKPVKDKQNVEHLHQVGIT